MNGERVRLSRRRLLEVGAGTAAAVAATNQFSSVHTARAASARQIAEVPREKTLILVGVGGESPNQFTDVDSVNPYLTGVSRGGYQLSYEPLAFYNMLTGEETLWLAESYKYNSDFTGLTVNMRQDGTWSDGTPITAGDVVFTLHMLRDDDGTLGWSTQIKQWVKEATAVDDYTLTISLNAPNPRFFFQFLTHHADIGIFIVPAHIWQGQDPRTFTNFDLAQGWPVVTGPYKLVQSTAEQKVWDRRDDWWAAQSGFKQLPAPERLIFLPGYDESKMAQMVIANEADATLNISPATMPTLFAQNPHIITHSGQDLPYGYTDWWPSGLGFNCETEPWNDPEIRWAISYAIDRDQLAQFGYRGAGEPTVLPYPYYPPLMEYIEGVSDLLDEYPTNQYDPAKTEEILTAKGYAKDGDGFWAKDGQRLSMVITTFSVFADIAPFVTEQLQNAGIDATFQMPTNFIDELMTGQGEAYIWGHGGSVRDPFATMELYHQKFYKPTGEAVYPFYRWRNDAYDAVVDEMGVTATDDPKMMELFRAGTEIWLRELPDPPLLQFYHRIPMNQTYWTNWPTAENPYINGAFWHRTCLLIILGLQAATA
ncbi:MAG: ABC transporter substrate-binding protein [Thermomicrobiales bacterium]